MVVHTCSHSYSKGLRWEDHLSLGKVEAAVRHDCATVLLPGKQSETVRNEREKRKIRKEKERGGWITRSDRVQPGQHGETQFQLKIQKFGGCSNRHL